MRKLFFTIVLCAATLAGYSQDAAALINSANEALQAKDYAKAFEQYDAAMKNLGDVQVDASINYNIGFAAFQADKFENAISYFNKAIEANANVAKSYEFIGTSYAKLNKFDEAIVAYKKSVETGAEDKGSIYYNGGVVAYQGKKYDQAVELFDLAIAENYENANNAYMNKSMALKRLNKDEESKQALVEAAEKFPGNSNIGKALANVYVGEANELYKKGAAILKAAGDKVNAGTLKTTDAAYTSELNKSKVEFKAALEILLKAKELDATNANVGKLIPACEAALK